MKKSFREMNSFREKHREEAFQRYLESSKPYFEAVKAAGAVEWFNDAEKLAKLENQCPGISQLRGERARRKLFMRRRA